jgi:hypothetical protein
MLSASGAAPSPLGAASGLRKIGVRNRVENTGCTHKTADAKSAIRHDAGKAATAAVTSGGRLYLAPNDRVKIW